MKMKEQKTWNDKDVPYIPKGFVKQLDKGKHIVITSDQDRVYVYDGREGVGKSTLAMQHAFHLDPTLNLDQVVFKSSDFKNKIRTLPKNKALIWDEAFKGLSSKGSLTKENKKIVTLLQECRQRNLFIFIILPTIFLLEKYAAIFRSNALIHVAAYKRNFKMRYFKVYNYENKKLLYIFGKQLMSYSKPKINKSYRFYGKMPPTITRKAYEAKKRESFRDTSEDKDVETKAMQQRNCLFHYLHTEYGLSYGQISEILEKCDLGMDKSVIGRHIRVMGRQTA